VFREFSKGSIRLAKCTCCQNFADKYVEWESMLIILDLVLHKRAVYRHLLVNTLSLNPARRSSTSIPNLGAQNGGVNNSPSATPIPVSEAKNHHGQAGPSLSMIFKLVIVYVFCDAYLRWARLKAFHDPPSVDIDTGLTTSDIFHDLANQTFYHNVPHNFSRLNSNWSSEYPISSNSSNSSSLAVPYVDLLSAIVQMVFINHSDKPYERYLAIFGMAIFNIGVYVSAFVLLAAILTKSFNRSREVVFTVFLSMFGKLFTLVMMIWDYDIWLFGRGVDTFVLTSNITALKVLLPLSDFGSLFFIAAANLIRISSFFLLKYLTIVPEELMPSLSVL